MKKFAVDKGCELFLTWCLVPYRNRWHVNAFHFQTEHFLNYRTLTPSPPGLRNVVSDVTRSDLL